MDSKYKVLIADDEKSSRENISLLLKEYPDFSIVKVAATGDMALKFLKEESFDIAFLDIGMPGLTGIEVVKELNELNIFVPFIVYITAFSHHATEAYNLGAIDYLLKPASPKRLKMTMEKYSNYTSSLSQTDKNESIEDKLKERFQLTPKEIEICKLVKDGFVRSDIQTKLNLSQGTIKSHLKHIYEKSGLTSKGEGRSDKFSQLLFLLFNL